jgi:hypothetical protein
MPVLKGRAKLAVQGSFGVRPVRKSIPTIAAEHRGAFPLRPPCGKDGEYWFAQRHLMGSAILDASRWEGDDAVGEVDLGPL